MTESSESLHAELARLMGLISEARDAGNDELAETLTERAAQCLMQVAGVPLSNTPQQPAQQQQQIQSKKDK